MNTPESVSFHKKKNLTSDSKFSSISLIRYYKIIYESREEMLAEMFSHLTQVRRVSGVRFSQPICRVQWILGDLLARN